MPMQRMGARTPCSLVWHGTTAMLVPTNADKIAIQFHGWPGADPASVALDALARSQRTGGGYPVDALLATGHAVVYPWLGESWGSLAASEQALMDVSAVVDAVWPDGFPFPDPGSSGFVAIGGSMGAINAISFAVMAGPSVAAIRLYNPLVSLGETWDLGSSIRTSIEAVWGVGRDTVLTNSVNFDPVQIDCSPLVGKTEVIAASNDVLINYSTVESWCDQWGLPLTTHTAGHFSLDDPAVNEIALLP